MTKYYAHWCTHMVVCMLHSTFFTLLIIDILCVRARLYVSMFWLAIRHELFTTACYERYVMSL